jgi:serine/threonine protein kinase
MEKYCPKCFTKHTQATGTCPHDGSALVSSTDKDLTGEILDDRYTILERIGRGGMGVVYRAEQQLIKRIVALKVLRRDIVQDESAVKRFLNEARAIGSLDSQHTVTLHDFGVTQDGLLYYTMEMLKGRSLAQIIREESPIEHVRAAVLVLQACRSLEEAHESNILHRDIKPDNLFVTVKKGRERLKVLDFGIAKLIGDASVETITRTGMIVGTPQYLSPEQALGNPVVPASDLYSLAIVLYELIAGKPPFSGETPLKTLWAHIRSPLPPFSKSNPKVRVPTSIQAFLTRALEKEPGKRFQSVPAFADALKRAVEDHDASPEIVSLPPLSTTDQGLRIRSHEGDEAQDEVASEIVQPQEAESEDTAGPAETGDSASVIGVSPPMEGDQTEAPRGSAVVPPGGNTLLWGVGAVVVVLTVALVLIWAPWKESPHTELATETEGAIESPGSQPSGAFDVEEDLGWLMEGTDVVVIDPATIPSSGDADLFEADADQTSGLADTVETITDQTDTSAADDSILALPDTAPETSTTLLLSDIASTPELQVGPDVFSGHDASALSDSPCRPDMHIGTDSVHAVRDVLARDLTRPPLEIGQTADSEATIESSVEANELSKKEQAKRAKIDYLLAKSKSALARQDFSTCIARARTAAGLEPGNRKARKLLKECKDKKDLESLKF